MSYFGLNSILNHSIRGSLLGCDINDFRAQPSRRNLAGGVIGAGFRFLDEYQNKVAPG
jgi:hypothetical protein